MSTSRLGREASTARAMHYAYDHNMLPICGRPGSVGLTAVKRATTCKTCLKMIGPQADGHGWYDIKHAPRDGKTVVDLWVDNHRVPNCRWSKGLRRWLRPAVSHDSGYPVANYLNGKITHFRPVPLPPMKA